MERISYIEIVGKRYPLNFSTKAAQIIGDKYGDIFELGKAFEKDRIVEMTDEFLWLLSVLMEQGAAYQRIVCGEEITALTYEQLAVVVGFRELIDMQETIMGAVMGGMGREVETEPDGKNAEAAQSEPALRGITTGDGD